MYEKDDQLRLTLTQIAAYIGMTERNVSRRIHELPPGHKLHVPVVDQGDGTYLVQRGDLERFIPAEQLALYVERTAQLQAQIDALERRVQVLEGGSAGEIEEPRYSNVAELPDGTMTLQEFAQLHQFDRRTLLSELMNPTNNLQHEAFPVPNRPRERNRYLTPDQQHAVIAFWRAHGRAFTECELCKQGKH